MPTPHPFHGVLDIAPIPCFLPLRLALAGLGIAGRLGDGIEAVPFDHLSRDSVDLHLGGHFTSPDVPMNRSPVRGAASLENPRPAFSFHRPPCMRGAPVPVRARD